MYLFIYSFICLFILDLLSRYFYVFVYLFTICLIIYFYLFISSLNHSLIYLLIFFCNLNLFIFLLI